MTRTPQKTTAKNDSPPKAKPSRDRAPLLEWIAAALGLVLTTGAIGFLGWDSLQQADGPPALAVTTGSPVRTPAGYYVAVQLKNEGRTTASSVEVEGRLKQGASVVEAASITFDFVPEGSERSGGLYFQHDPRAFEISVATKGQIDP